MLSMPPSTVRFGRALHEANLPHTCRIRRPTTEYVNGEPLNPPYITRDTDVPCRVRPAGTVEQRAVAGQLDAPAKFQVTFTVGTVVEPNDLIDQIVVDDPTITFPATLSVTGDHDGGAGRTMRKVIAAAVPV